ncbi:MAG: hypothetical protein IJ129_01205 [Ruminococcus sp.]|nr:hypothetical protein [Ruminococcus sp.]
MKTDPINEENQKIDELVEMIDRMMERGDGHININAMLSEKEQEELSVQTYRSNDCGTGACCQPNEKAPDEEAEF